MIRRFINPILNVTPRLFFTGLIAAVFLLPSINGLFYGISAPNAKEINTFVFAFLTLLYGSTRCIRFHPAFSKTYQSYLSISPYDSQKPLPLGPILLYWPDFIVLSLVTGLSILFPTLHWLIPAIAFLAVYLLGISVALLMTDQDKYTCVMFLLAPFTWYPFQNIDVAFGVLLVLYAIAFLGVKDYLRNFPWNTSYWQDNFIKQLKKKAVTQRVIRWPYLQLNVNEPSSVSLRGKIYPCVLVFVWLHVSVWLAQEKFLSDGILLAGVILMGLFRVLIYASGFSAPISVLGRLVTFHWFIPGYDKVFIAPIVVNLTALSCYFVLHRMKLSGDIVNEILFCLCLFLTLTLPPSLRSWQLTGHHHLISTSKASARPKMR